MTTPSNETIGGVLGVSHATVSRYRSGDRFPNQTVQARIEKVYGWSMTDQYQARQAGNYASEFTKRVVDRTPLGAVGEGKAPDQRSGEGKSPTHASTA